MTKQTVNINKKMRLHFFLLIAAGLLAPFISGPSLNSLAPANAIATRLSVGIISVLPLIAFIPTVLKPTPRSVSWLGFFLLAYMVWSILRLFSASWLGGLFIFAFNLTCFIYVVIWLRPFKKIAKQKQQRN